MESLHRSSFTSILCRGNTFKCNGGTPDYCGEVEWFCSLEPFAMLCWVLGGVISLDMTYILMRVIKVIVNIRSLLSVRARLCNGNLVKFCLWCPLSSLPCFLLQVVWAEKRDVCRHRESKASVLCCSIKGDTAISKVTLKPWDHYFKIWLLATKTKS